LKGPVHILIDQAYFFEPKGSSITSEFQKYTETVSENDKKKYLQEDVKWVSRHKNYGQC